MSAPVAIEPNVDQLMDIIERVMTQHWDMAACPCWFCTEGRAAGCRPREMFLRFNKRRPRVTVALARRTPEGTEG